METSGNCICSASDSIVLACSGASDLGHVTDLVARKLRDDGVCKMNCLAVAGANIESSIAQFKNAKLLVIDGCNVDCGRIIMSKSGIEDYTHVRLTDYGFKKGETQVTDTTINTVYSQVAGLI